MPTREVTWQSTGPQETEGLAGRFARALASVVAESGGWLEAPALAILLHGPLGAGKSVFARAFLRALGIAATGSPSFNLLKEYQEPVPARHLDLYRLERWAPGDLDWLSETLLGPGPSLVEWPERLPLDVLPDERLDVRFERPDPCQPEMRLFSATATGSLMPLALRRMAGGDAT